MVEARWRMIGVVAAVWMGCASPPPVDPQPVAPVPDDQTTEAENASASPTSVTVDSIAGDLDFDIREWFGVCGVETSVENEEPDPDTVTWDIPITFNDAVDRWLEYFQTDGRQNFELYLTRAGRYEPMMRAVLRDAGLPEDLVYMSLIESGFSPRAYSRARAVGLWQFMASTGRAYDLRISYWVDERRDPILATKAAASHLGDLYDEFDSWYLAAAAYNAGVNRVRRSIRRTGSDDYWTLSRRRYLRRETRNYVPKLIAAALIAKEPEKYDFTGIEPELPFAYDLVEVPDATSVDVIAKAAGVDIESVVELNPQILRGVTPPGERYALRVPPGSGHSFALNYASVPPNERVTWVQHVVRRGDTLGEIAQAYGVSVAAIRAANNNIHPRRLRVGQYLMIPRAGHLPKYTTRTVSTQRVQRTRTAPRQPPGPYLTYTVQSGDSLWTIAQQYAVTTRDLMRWNGLRTSRIYPGDRVRIYVGGSD